MSEPKSPIDIMLEAAFGAELQARRMRLEAGETKPACCYACGRPFDEKPKRRKSKDLVKGAKLVPLKLVKKND